jgi:hypothetical protein
LPGTNTPAYFAQPSAPKKKKFYSWTDTWGLFHKTFYDRNLQMFVMS